MRSERSVCKIYAFIEVHKNNKYTVRVGNWVTQILSLSDTGF